MAEATSCRRTLTGALLVAVAVASGPAVAQRNVDVDLGALDQLGPAPAKKPPPAAKPAKPARAAPPKAAAPLQPVAPPPPPVIAEPERPREPPAPKAAAPRQQPAPPLPPAAVAEPVVPREPPPPATLPMPAAPASAAAPGDTPIPVPPAPPGSIAAAPTPPTRAPVTTPAISPNLGRALAPVATIAFPPSETDLPDGAAGALDGVADRLAKDEKLRVEVLAYAEGTDVSQARRLSLSRALSVRSYLADKGVRPQRVELKPLGHPADLTGPADRIDIVVAER